MLGFKGNPKGKRPYDTPTGYTRIAEASDARRSFGPPGGGFVARMRAPQLVHLVLCWTCVFLTFFRRTSNPKNHLIPCFGHTKKSPVSCHASF